MNRYDIWLTNPPDELDPDEPCLCGHPWSAHDADGQCTHGDDVKRRHGQRRARCACPMFRSARDEYTGPDTWAEARGER